MVRIFIEAKKEATSEFVFVKSYLAFLGIEKNLYEIVCVDGKDNLKNCRNKFAENTIEGGRNLVVFDADFPKTNGGFQTRRSDLLEQLKEMGAEADLFLFPNNADDGIFENLLENLMLAEKHKQLLDCYHDYELCLGKDYVAPNTKGKVFTYISSQKGLSNTQRNKLGSGQWLFDNSLYWNLDCDYLRPFKEFLLTYLKEKK